MYEKLKFQMISYFTFVFKDLFINWGDEEKDLKRVYNVEMEKVDDCRQVRNVIKTFVEFFQVHQPGL